MEKLYVPQGGFSRAAGGSPNHVFNIMLIIVLP